MGNTLTEYLMHNRWADFVLEAVPDFTEPRLRFELGNRVDSSDYFANAVNRAVELFENINDKHDSILLLQKEWIDDQPPYNDNNFLFQQIDDLDRDAIEYYEVALEPDDDRDINCFLTVVPTLSKNINHRNLLEAISNLDFSDRKPEICCEVRFLNITKGICFYMYDDRGLDITAKERKSLYHLYTKFNHWILDWNRERINAELGIN